MSSSHHDSPLHDSVLHDSHLHDSLQLDSNEFCTTLRLPGRVYEAVEPPDNPKAIIHHSNTDYVEKEEDILGKEEFSLIENSHIGSILKVVKRNKVQFSEELFHFLMQRRVLTQGEDLWFTFSDQPMRFSLREFHLTTGLRCKEDQTITEPQFKIMKKPYLWMLGKNDKFTVRMLYEMFKEKAQSMPTLERLSLGTTIITEAVIMAENPSSKIPRDRLQRYMNYHLPKMAWGDSYEVSGFALAINLWAMSSVNVLGKSLGKPCETSSSSDPLCLHWDSTRTPTITEVLELEKINNVHKSVSCRDYEEENKDEEYQKDKEHRKDKDHSMSNSEKLDKLIQMVRDLDKRVVVIQNVLGVKFNDGSPNKEDCENIASSGDRRSAKDYENEEDTIDEEANSGDKNSALDDENEEAICDEEAKSGTEHLREEENIFGENETTQKITQDEDTEKLKSESCLKQTSHVISPTPTFNTPNFDTRVSSPTPTFTSPKFDLLSQESHSGKGETMSKSDDKIALPKRISEPGTNGGVLDRINKRSNLKLVGTVENVLGREFKKLEDSFLAPVIKMGRRQKHMVFSRHLIHHLLLRRIDIGKKGLWFSFGEQLMRFSLREFHLATGLPCVVDKDEEEVETSATKNKKKDPWMKKNQTLNTLLNLLVKKSTELTADQRLRLGATILVEGILMASNPVTSIPEERLLRARNFKEFCNDLVEDVDCEFGRVVDLVKRGYRLKRHNWLNGSVDIAVAEAEVDENNSARGIDATDQEKIEFLTKKVVSVEEKVKYLECLLNIRGETVKETEKSKESEAATKTKVWKEEWCKTSSGVDHQDEDDIEVEHGAKESDTSKVNEPQEEEEQQEDDTEVDVEDGDKESGNSETNEVS
ncbi:hypothetical protein F2Q70_00044586 [Brassica cretica]|uniref:DUF1985 domain-containing protein n=2 Tax=Brassica TaxID=3705 RepID=A0A8S9KH95_BRACR|nr:hypothetical protein F2Q70_00044586 [Brassica cretica]